MLEENALSLVAARIPVRTIEVPTDVFGSRPLLGWHVGIICVGDAG
jgi:hypothetical protein